MNPQVSDARCPELDRWILAIADDLTGALKANSQVECLGARVTTDLSVPGPPERFPMLVTGAETRHLAPNGAGTVVREAVAAALRFHPWLVYKKTDSMLRGNIAAECGSLLELMPHRSLRRRRESREARSRVRTRAAPTVTT